MSELAKQITEELAKQIKEEQATVYVWVCPICGYRIQALIKNQTLTWAMNHYGKHARQGVKA